MASGPKPFIPLNPATDPVAQARALIKKGARAQAATLLRNVLVRDGRNGAARQMLAGLGPEARRAVSLTPQDKRAAKAIQAAMEAGQWRQVVSEAQSLLQRQPHVADAANALGNALFQLGRPKDALGAFNHAVRVDPVQPDGYLNISALYLSLEQPDAARQAAEAALDVAPKMALAHRALGLALIDALRVAEGEAALRDACALDPKDPLAWDALCRALEQSTRLEDLDDTVTEALRHCPGDPLLRLQQAGLLARRKEFAATLETLDGLSTAALPLHSQSIAAQLRGQALDALQQDGALQAFAEMNAAQARLHHVTTPLPFLTRLDARAGGLSDFDALDWQTDPAAPGPVFLVGFPRSGTTLLDSILRGHEGVAVVEEQPLITPLTDGIPESGEAAALSALTESQLAERRAGYLAAFEAQIGAPLGDRMAIDKMPLNMTEAGTLARHFPNARFILALRHPADCVLSGFMQNFRPNDAMNTFLDLDSAAEAYDKAFTLFEGYRARLGLSVVEIRYEHLIRDLRGAVEPVLDHLGLTWRDEMADYQKTVKARPMVRTPSYRQVTETLYTGADGRWKRYETDLQPVLDRLSPWIDRWGYAV
ncbi:tetratricopeptide repeat-containing sulfotransferase family protein [Pacificoceanicola onchidii]|uniref:tetratricopeptide repeat-containing sulfotransferase family protein n=1 Tax=Pacificoceanicola onchidii TaxID=2562685 RepID=UPI0010A666C4|nr:tetratricopeptide repeat-containing sulfotransferase family protein [Pacificoceanicola onchidii]